MDDSEYHKRLAELAEDEESREFTWEGTIDWEAMAEHHRHTLGANEERIPPLLGWENVDLAPPEEPELLGLFPLGSYSSIYGRGGKNKSWLAQCLMIECARKQLRTVFIDAESDIRRALLRFVKLGSSSEELSPWVAYTNHSRPDKSLAKALSAWGTQVVLIDSMQMTGGGQDEAKFDDWHRKFVVPILAMGITVVSIDHDNKSIRNDDGERRTIGPSGAHEKFDRIQGTALWVSDEGVALTEASDGRTVLVVDKANHGRCRHRRFVLTLKRNGQEGLEERIDWSVEPLTDLLASQLDTERSQALSSKERGHRQRLREAFDGEFTLAEAREVLGIGQRRMTDLAKRICEQTSRKRGSSNLWQIP